MRYIPERRDLRRGILLTLFWIGLMGWFASIGQWAFVLVIVFFIVATWLLVANTVHGNTHDSDN